MKIHIEIRIFICFCIMIFLIKSNLFAYPIVDAFRKLEFQSYSISDKKLIIHCDYADLFLEFHSENIIKLGLRVNNESIEDTSFIVITKPTIEEVRIIDNIDFVSIATDSIEAKVFKNPLKIEYWSNGEMFLESSDEFLKVYNIRGLCFNIDETESLFGGGSRAIDINRRGNLLMMFNQNVYGYEYGETWLNTCVPFVFSSNKYGLYFDNHSLSYLDLDLENKNKIRFNSEDLKMNVYIIKKDSYQEIINEYLQLTGMPRMLPKWAFGYIMSKCYYNSTDEIIYAKDQMRDSGIKLDAFIFDLSWFGTPKSMGNFQWDATMWDNPIKMLEQLKSSNIHSVLISEPYFSIDSKNFPEALEKGYFSVYENGEVNYSSILQATVALLDITNPEAREWFWDLYKARTVEGIDGWWCDMGEPDIHHRSIQHFGGKAINIRNIFAYQWLELLWEKLTELRPNERPFLLSRSAWAGAQRFGVINQCGDARRSFSTLKAQIPLLLGMGVSGMAYSNSDIGGYTGENKNPQPELYARWHQFGAFSPIMRVHIAGPVPAEPFHYSNEIQNIVKKYIDLRYKLLPYNYTLSYEYAKTGKPLARPINFYDENTKALDISNQYYWGDNLIVAPIYTEEATSRDVYLPEGIWFDFWNNSSIYGGQTFSYNADLSTLPLFVKAGSIIPTATIINNTADYNSDSLTIWYYPDSSITKSFYTLYDDNGLGNDLNTNMSQFVDFSLDYCKDSLVIQHSISHINFQQAIDKYYKYIIKNIDFPPNKIKVNNLEFDISDIEHFKDLIPYFHYNKQTKELEIAFSIQSFETNFIIYFPKNVDVICSISNFEMQVYPIPFNDVINITIKDLEQMQFTIAIYDALGQKIYESQNFSDGNGLFESTISNTIFSSKGLHYLVLKSKGNIIATKKLVNI